MDAAGAHEDSVTDGRRGPLRFSARGVAREGAGPTNPEQALGDRRALAARRRYRLLALHVEHDSRAPVGAARDLGG